MDDINVYNEETLKTIFDLMFNKLKTISINNNFMIEITDRRTRVFNKNLPDSYFFEDLVRDIHNAGMKAKVVTSKLPHIKKAFSNFDINQVADYTDEDFERLLNNPNIIHHRRKLNDCITNARTMRDLSKQYGSFGEFLDQHKDNFEELKERILGFRSVGNAVALDYLKDIGMDFIKPDIHVLRIFSRLGLISSENEFNEAILVAEAFKKATNERLSVIDAVFWMYGGGGDGHLQKAICNKNNPLCGECPVTKYCLYYTTNH